MVLESWQESCGDDSVGKETPEAERAAVVISVGLGDPFVKTG